MLIEQSEDVSKRKESIWHFLEQKILILQSSHTIVSLKSSMLKQQKLQRSQSSKIFDNLGYLGNLDIFDRSFQTENE